MRPATLQILFKTNMNISNINPTIAASQQDCCHFGNCDQTTVCWERLSDGYCACFPSKSVLPGWVKKPIKGVGGNISVNRLTQTTTEEQKAALLQSRQAANFTNPTMGGSCASCLGNICGGGETCWHRQTGTETGNIKWECKCFPQSTNPNLPPAGGWIPKFFDRPSASVKIRPTWPNQMF